MQPCCINDGTKEGETEWGKRSASIKVVEVFEGFEVVTKENKKQNRQIERECVCVCVREREREIERESRSERELCVVCRAGIPEFVFLCGYCFSAQTFCLDSL